VRRRQTDSLAFLTWGREGEEERERERERETENKLLSTCISLELHLTDVVLTGHRCSGSTRGLEMLYECSLDTDTIIDSVSRRRKLSCDNLC